MRSKIMLWKVLAKSEKVSSKLTIAYGDIQLFADTGRRRKLNEFLDLRKRTLLSNQT
jgi:hypothetical protein